MSEKTVVSRTIVAVLMAGLLLTSSGCSLLARDLPRETPNPRASGGGGLMDLVDWGVVDGLLSVRLRNDNDRVLQRAEAVISVRLSDGSSWSAGASVGNDLCCTVVDVPPGEDFGVYVDLGPGSGSVDEVDVSFDRVSWAPQEDDVPPASVRTAQAELVAGDSGAAVEVRLKARGRDVKAVAGQAFLVDEAGDFLAVVSGRFACFPQGESRDVVMELYHPVPEGTSVESVVAYPMSDPSLTDDAQSCPE